MRIHRWTRNCGLLLLLGLSSAAEARPPVLRPSPPKPAVRFNSHDDGVPFYGRSPGTHHTSPDEGGVSPGPRPRGLLGAAVPPHGLLGEAVAAKGVVAVSDPSVQSYEVAHSQGTTTVPQIRAQLRTTNAANLLVRSPELLPLVRRAIAEDNAAGRLALYQRTSSDLGPTLTRLAQPIESLETIVSIPRNPAEAFRVHGDVARSVSASYWGEQHGRVANRLTKNRTLDIAGLKSTADTLAAAVRVRLRESSAELITVIAEHRGGALRFIDGSALPTADVSRANGKLVSILGCSSATQAVPKGGGVVIGTGRRITYTEAIDIANRFDELIRVQGRFVARDLLLDLQNSAVRAEQSIVGVAIRFGILSGALLIELVET